MEIKDSQPKMPATVAAELLGVSIQAIHKQLKVLDIKCPKIGLCKYKIRKNISFLKKLIIRFNLFINKPYIIDAIFGYRKIPIDLKKIKNLDIKKLEKMYRNLPDFKTFNRN